MKKVPPYTHNLKQLAFLSDIELNEEQLNFIALLMPLNIEARYLKNKEMMFKSITRKKNELVIKKTEEMYKWIKILLK